MLTSCPFAEKNVIYIDEFIGENVKSTTFFSFLMEIWCGYSYFLLGM